MKRVHLVEFHELEWFPATWRDLLTDFLSFFASTIKPYRVVADRLRTAVDKADADAICDLCSGAARPILTVVDELAKRHGTLPIVISDKFPNQKAFRAIEKTRGDMVRPVYEPVDATDTPPDLHGFRTLFTAFHHFNSRDARNIIADAVNKKQGIGVFEYTERRLPWLFFVCGIPFAVLLSSPFMKPFSWKRIFFTYLVPVTPVFTFIDGVVSCMRTYSPEELEHLIQEVQRGGSAEGYVWEVGRERFLPFMNITYLIGYPARRREQERSSRNRRLPVS